MDALWRASRPMRWPLLMGGLLAMLYLILAWRLTGSLAFPLDDAWIHQSYARTVAAHGQWAFLPGQPSSGSTAPLWTLLLAPAHLLPLSPVLWSHALGLLGWAATVGLGGALAWQLFKDRTIALWGMAALAAEWHLMWAALSGMEITLFCALALGLLYLTLAGPPRPWLWGLLGGLLTLTRPEGLWLVGLLAAYHAYYVHAQGARSLRPLAAWGAGLAIVIAPVALFNWQVSGHLFPNTLYAKQQEYAALLDVPLVRRLLTLAWQPWIGGQALLLVALPWLPWRHFRVAHWLPLLWAAGSLLMYALRLPVTYQHGRYLIPTIPIFVLYGVAGGTIALRRARALLRPALAAGLITGFALFALLGALAYARDIAWIECEMGSSARWVAAHSAPGTLIAAHDIGRLGYLTQRPLLDFAGLISPETIPLIRDERALLDLAQRRGARYVVAFADWYPTLAQDPRLTPRFATTCAPLGNTGQQPMTVYELHDAEAP